MLADKMDKIEKWYKLENEWLNKVYMEERD